MRIPARAPDIVAEISLLSTGQGGRHTPALSGYSPNHNFGLESGLCDGVHEYIGLESLAPGCTSGANVWLLTPELQKGRLYSGFKFTVQEGARIVGHGVITRVVNDGLRRGGAGN